MDRIRLLKNTSDKNVILILGLMFLFLLGEFIGTVIFRIIKFDRNNNLIEMFFYNRLESTFLQTVINSFSGTFVLIALCIFLGMGAFAQPLEFMIPLFHGIGIGILLSDTYFAYGIKGIICSVFLIVPYSVLSSFIVIIAVREAVRMSNALSRNIINSNEHVKIDLNLYLTKYIILLFLLIILSVLNALVTFLGAELWTGLL